MTPDDEGEVCGRQPSPSSSSLIPSAAVPTLKAFGGRRQNAPTSVVVSSGKLILHQHAVDGLAVYAGGARRL